MGDILFIEEVCLNEIAFIGGNFKLISKWRSVENYE